MTPEQIAALLKAFNVTPEAIAEVQNSGTPEEHELIKFAKGVIAPEDIAVNGVLTPSQSSKFVDLIQNANEFLKEITVQPMDKLKTNYDVWDIARGILVRVPEGSKPTSRQLKKIKNSGRMLVAQPMQLFATLTKSSILNNRHKPNFAGWLEKKYSTAMANDMAYLGFVGKEDDYSNDNFENLNKGWIQVAKDDTDTKKVTYAESDTIKDRLDKLVEKADDTMPDNAKIMIHRKDFLKYCSEIGTSTNTSDLIITAAAKGHSGYEFKITNDMPRGEYMLTPLKNLVFGIVAEVGKSREWNGQERAINYTFDVNVDYDIAVPAYVTIATQAS